MNVTKPPKALPHKAAKASTNAASGVKIDPAAQDGTSGSRAAALVGQRGPKVLQSRQARQRCLEFSRG